MSATETQTTGPEAEKPETERLTLKRILVPTDFSGFSEKALRYAIPLAQAFGATISLVYADETNYGEIACFGIVDVAQLKSESLKKAEERLASMIRDHGHDAVPTATTVRIGRAKHVIAEVAKEQQIDLIVIATHGHTGLKHILMGSTTENVVRHAPCPVLAVRQIEREFVKTE